MLRIRSLFTGVPGSPYYSNLFFDGDDSVSAQAAVTSVQSIFTDIMPLCAAPIVVTIEPFVASVDPVSGDVVGGFSTTPVAQIGGTGAGQPIPRSSQLLVQLRTGVYVAGREIRGKFNLPYVSEEHNVGAGVPSPGAYNGVATAFQDVLSTGPDLLVWSRKNGQAAQVSSVTGSDEWAVLRSRRD